MFDILENTLTDLNEKIDATHVCRLSMKQPGNLSQHKDWKQLAWICPEITKSSI